MDPYVNGKTDFILDILKKGSVKNSDIELIENQNKTPKKTARCYGMICIR